MSLQIWLPLTKNAKNQGCHPSNVTVSNATYNDNGKLGGCYSFSNSAYLMGTQSIITNNTNEWSFACWMKLNATTTGQTLFSCRTAANATGITIFYYGSQWLIDDGTRWQFTPTNTIVANKWYHVCVVRKKGAGKYLYIDGVLDSSTTTTGTPSIVNTTNYAVGVCHNSATTVSGNPLNGYLNDVRFYDHALSPLEVSEIAKGLVVHYKLDDVQSSDNLITNGFGELGTENWTSSSAISTTEIPPNHPEIKASMSGGNTSVKYIPISPNHLYTISCYIKAMSGASGNKYPSLYAYDIDKKMIQYHGCTEGFATATATTLAQPLRHGDTVIYATDLSNWNTGTSNYYYYVAIFGYKNSLGEVYPDLTYTQDTPRFGTYSDKSHIDKENNTITLNAAYTGVDRPAGTTICQSTEGSTYYYPFGAVAVSSVQDWVFKTANFRPSGTKRLKPAAYVRWNTYNGLYLAGNKLVDKFFYDDKVIDSSGYGNHGTKNGNITMSSNTMRYTASTVFDGSTAYIDIVSSVFPAVLNGTFTISMWVYNSDSGNRSILFGNYGISSTSIPFNIEKTTAETVRFYWNASTDKTFTNSILTVNAFTHLVVTRNGNTIKSYINGVLKDTAAVTISGTIPTTETNFRIAADGRTGATLLDGRISDFRLYATELTDSDILTLYHTGARVADNGAMTGYEMKEG